MQKKKLSTETYKGVRDFYPEDTRIQNYLFGVMRKTAQQYGYVEYNASILEPADLYKAKSGEEIINEQTYTFTDRGGREVTLRPEMTPTTARMVAARRRELSYPLRLYSIPNLFRYEQPQKGRLREHWQLNVDIFGISTNDADLEILTLAHKMLKNFNAKDSDFNIIINDRRVSDELYKKFDLKEKDKQALSKLIDKKKKISRNNFVAGAENILGERTDQFISIIESPEKLANFLGKDNLELKNLQRLIERLELQGIKNVVFNPTLVRGFDYYTGLIFEGFDTNAQNPRSLFGGGRYDDLLSIFNGEKIPAVGFGAGDVVVRDFLECRNLVPDFASTTDFYIGVLNNQNDPAIKLASKLRELGANVAIDYSGKDPGTQLKKAIKDKIPYIIFVGETETKNKKFSVKNLATREESPLFGFGDEIKALEFIKFGR